MTTPNATTTGHRFVVLTSDADFIARRAIEQLPRGYVAIEVPHVECQTFCGHEWLRADLSDDMPSDFPNPHVSSLAAWCEGVETP